VVVTGRIDVHYPGLSRGFCLREGREGGAHGKGKKGGGEAEHDDPWRFMRTLFICTLSGRRAARKHVESAKRRIRQEKRRFLPGRNGSRPAHSQRSLRGR